LHIHKNQSTLTTAIKRALTILFSFTTAVFLDVREMQSGRFLLAHPVFYRRLEPLKSATVRYRYVDFCRQSGGQSSSRSL